MQEPEIAVANSLASPARVLYRSQIGKCEKLSSTESCILIGESWNGFLFHLDKKTHLKYQPLGTSPGEGQVEWDAFCPENGFHNKAKPM